MSLHPIEAFKQPSKGEGIELFPRPYTKARYFAVVLICCAVVIAGFAATEIWRAGGMTADMGQTTGEGIGTPSISDTLPPTALPNVPSTGIASFTTNMDLSYVERGALYINNVTSRTVDPAPLLKIDVSSAPTNAPLVLILHTHTGEGYWNEARVDQSADPGEMTYTRDEAYNVVSVGNVLRESLQKNGITAIHCAVMHDDPSIGGSYERAAESIRFYLEQYPTIRYVIDLHRDAVMTDDGKYVRAVTKVHGEDVAQVMCVVGSDGNGFACENWQDNLALALQLRAVLNAEDGRICRPVFLRNATYNQELAPYSLLLEIGTGANSIAEAKRAAELVGDALAELIFS